MVFNIKEYQYNLFVLLHEIGHSLNNNTNMDLYRKQIAKIFPKNQHDLYFKIYGYSLLVDEERFANNFALSKLDEAWNYIVNMRRKIKKQI